MYKMRWRRDIAISWAKISKKEEICEFIPGKFHDILKNNYVVRSTSVFAVISPIMQQQF